MTDETNIPWEPLGYDWWHETGRKYGANQRQIAFAACIDAGTMTQKQAAILAGFSSETDRKATLAGSSAASSKKVKVLLDAAQVARKLGDLPEPKREKLSRSQLLERMDEIARGPDATLAMKAAIELLKEDDKSTGTGRGVFLIGDGFDTWRTVRDHLLLPGGAVAIASFYTARGGDLCGIPLLHDVVALINRDDPEYLEVVRRRQSQRSLLELDQQLANPQWQYEAREKLWREVGLSIAEVEAQATGATTNGSTHVLTRGRTLPGGMEITSHG